MNGYETAPGTRRANDPCQAAGRPSSEGTSKGTAPPLSASASVANLDWRRVLVAYLQDDDSPVTVWLAEVDGRLGQAGDTVPLYGSPGWEAAPGPARLRSALRAGEAWRRASLYVAAELADENDAAAPEAQAEAADTSSEWSRLAKWVADHRGDATFAELTARRAVPVRPAVPAW